MAAVCFERGQKVGIRAEMHVSSSCPDRMEEEKLHSPSRESTRLICLQVFPAYLLAGLGMVMAGLLLDRVQVSDTKTR